MLTNAQAAEGVAEQIKATGSSESAIASALEVLFDGWILPVRDAVLAKKLQEQITRYDDLFSVAVDVVCLGALDTVAELPVSPSDGDCYFTLEAETGYPNGQFYVAIDGVWIAQGDRVIKGRTGTGVPESGGTEGDVLYYSTGGAYWDAPATGGGSGEWGDIGGTLADQTDLQAALDLKIPTSYLDTDTALAANSDSKIATQKATKAYVDALIAANDAMVFKGVIDCSANPNYPAADRGWTYRVSVAGKIGGASGVNVQAGDVLLCLTDSTASGNHATVGSAWGVIQVNIDGALTTADVGSVVAAYSAAIAQIAALSPGADTTLQWVSGTWQARSVAQVKTTLALNNVNNTSDADKPVSTAAQTALNLKIPTSYLDTDTTLAANSDTKLATQKAVKAYVDANAGGGSAETWTATAITSSGSYAVPDGATRLEVICIGAAGGGSSGASGTSGSSRFGGVGGGAGGYSRQTMLVADLSAGDATTLTITIGAGGGGGSGVTGTSAGSAGSAGGDTTVADGATVIAFAGGGSGGGAPTASAAGTAGAAAIGNYPSNTGGVGGAATSSAVAGSRTSGVSPGAGGGGAGLTTGGTTSTGAAGSDGYAIGGDGRKGAGGTGSAGGAGGAGTAKTYVYGSGGGGAGGGATASTNGGVGGAGAAPGGGGGGGGGARDTYTSGAGGAGARGEVIIIAIG